MDKNEESVRSSIPRSDMMTTSEDDFCANKAYTHLEPCEVRMSASVARSRENCARCARLPRCAIHTLRRVLGGLPSNAKL